MTLGCFFAEKGEDVSPSVLLHPNSEFAGRVAPGLSGDFAVLNSQVKSSGLGVLQDDHLVLPRYDVEDCCTWHRSIGTRTSKIPQTEDEIAFRAKCLTTLLVFCGRFCFKISLSEFSTGSKKFTESANFSETRIKTKQSEQGLLCF